MKSINFYTDIFKYDCSTSMALDEIIYNKLKTNKEYIGIRYYRIKNKSLTIGKHQRIDSVNTAYCKKHNIEISRRITGGRGVFHSNDIIITAVFNKNNFDFQTKQEIFNFLPNIIRKVLTKQRFDFKLRDNTKEYTKNFKKIGNCFNLPVKGELSFNNNKFFGVASYIEKGNVLQQASLQLNYTDEHKIIFNDSQRKIYYKEIMNSTNFFNIFNDVINQIFLIEEKVFTKQEIIQSKELSKKRYGVKL